MEAVSSTKTRKKKRRGGGKKRGCRVTKRIAHNREFGRQDGIGQKRNYCRECLMRGSRMGRPGKTEKEKQRYSKTTIPSSSEKGSRASTGGKSRKGKGASPGGRTPSSNREE